MKQLLFFSVFFLSSISVSAAEFELRMLPGESWWGGAADFAVQSKGMQRESGFRPRSNSLSKPAGTCAAECAMQTAAVCGFASSHRSMRESILRAAFVQRLQHGILQNPVVNDCDENPVRNISIVLRGDSAGGLGRVMRGGVRRKELTE
jgi:hypothetical protein